MNKSRNNIAPFIIAVILILAAAVLITVAGTQKSSGERTVVGIVMTGSCDEPGWNSTHYNGALEACREFGLDLIAKENIPEGTDKCAEAVEELIAEGASVIMLSSYGYSADAAEVSKKHPDIRFYCASGDSTADNMTCYFARMYQARYVSGIIAASQTKSHNIGYVAAERNSEVIRGIDAFTLGAVKADPEITVNVIFTESWNDRDTECNAVNRLVNEFDCDVITYHQNRPYAAMEADSLGVCSIGYHEKADGLSDRYLTSIGWNWQIIYHELIRDFCQGKGDSIKRYWLGIDTGAVSFSEFSPLISGGTRTIVNQTIEQIKLGHDVFSGPVYDNRGELRCGESEMIGDDELFCGIDWFVQGVKVHE